MLKIQHDPAELMYPNEKSRRVNVGFCVSRP